MLRVLLYGDMNLNIIDGSSVWLTSICNIFKDQAFWQLDLLLKCPPQEPELFEEISGSRNVRIINAIDTPAGHELTTPFRLTPADAVKCIGSLHAQNDYHLIIVRGFEVVKRLVKKDFSDRVLPYVTDFNHAGDGCEKEYAELLGIYNSVENMFVQTAETGRFLSNALNVDGNKFQTLLPMIPEPPATKPEIKVQNYSLAYIGKFAKDWHTEEILLAAKQINRLMSFVSFNIAGNKFQQNIQHKRDWLTSELTENAFITWHGGVSRSKAQDIIKLSDIGISWRSEVIDNDSSLELSTKLLEYGSAGKPVLLRRTKLHQSLLGNDYEAYVNSEEEFIEAVQRLFTEPDVYRRCGERVYARCQPFVFSQRRKMLAPLFNSYGPTKKRLLIAGHDLKFLKHATAYFQSHANFEVQIDHWKGHNIHDETSSQDLLKWADIVFCEWGLGNAVWYSNHKIAGQRLIVRMHGQERLTQFPTKFNFSHIDQFITVSPYMLELFHKIFHIPRHKFKVINNMVDTIALDQPKSAQDVKFNLGIAGILPKLKQPDKAIDILERLYASDKRYKLYIKTRKPEELAWLMNRPEEKDYYLELEKKISASPARNNIVYDPHGDDMPDWFTKIGYVLSTSEFESFHLTPLEGMAAGSVPIILEWPGSRSVQDSQFVFASIEEAANFIASENSQQQIGSEALKAFANTQCGLDTVLGQLEQILLDEN